MLRFVFLLLAAWAASCDHDWDRLDPALGPPSATGGAAAGGSGIQGGEGGQGGSTGGAGGEQAERCGDGVIDAGEECDDANDRSGDLCDGCVVECDGTKDATSLHCYRLFADPVTWDSARAMCVRWGGELVSITSNAEHIVVNSLYGTAPGPYWTGGNDIDREGTYVWSNGDPWGFAPWEDGEPNDLGFGVQNCVDIYDDAVAGPWLGDNACTDESPYICERDPPP